MSGWMDRSCWPHSQPWPSGRVLTTATAIVEDLRKGSLIVARSRACLLNWLQSLPAADRELAVEGEEWHNLTLWYTARHRDFLPAVTIDAYGDPCPV